MSIVYSHPEIKGKSLVELAGELEASVRKAAQQGKSLYEMEKEIFAYALQIGHRAVEEILMLQGDGDHRAAGQCGKATGASLGLG